MIRALDCLTQALTAQSPQPLRPVEKVSAHCGTEYVVWRLKQAWREGSPFGPDQAVLVRQAVRWSGATLFVPSLPQALRGPLLQAGVRWSEAGTLSAEPFFPDWLDHTGIDPARGIDARPTRRQPSEGVPAESYLQTSLGYSHWKSQALKEAAWQALQAPAGATLLIALPTGSGKSLCFHLLAGFSTGLTLVVVPTVALAIDQYRAACHLLSSIPDLNPKYYAADDPEFDPRDTAEALRTGGTRLLFTSPEACVSGRLRDILDELAGAGRLDNVVIDEAHMVATWGIYFRVDFQMLSMLWRRWRERAQNRIRTLLLSATFTPDCREGLKSLFGAEPWLEFVSQRLRPEPEYYLREFETEDERSQAVMDCVWRLPRPAILYTTRVRDAESWRDGLRRDGFSRVECFTGETSRQERRRLMMRWGADDIDLMIATSAFGLGVDKADVRTVLHACLPEDLDRFYQEVGRAGRDGASAVSLLLATPRDRRIAKDLGARLLRPDTIQARWLALWRSSEPTDEDRHIYKVRLRAKKSELVGVRTYEENVRWNKRLLLQLVRAGMIELVGLEYGEGDDESEWATIRLMFPPQAPDVANRIEVVRERELRILHDGFDRMDEYFSTRAPVCQILARLYGRGTVRVCGGCPGCRTLGRLPHNCPDLLLPPDGESRPFVAIVLGLPAPADPGKRNEMAHWLRRARSVKGIARFACAPNFMTHLLDASRQAFGRNAQPYRVDSLGDPTVGWELPFLLAPTESMVIVHGRTVHRSALRLARGREIVHWVCQGCEPVDERGKSWLDQPGVIPYATPDAWIESGGFIDVHGQSRDADAS
jgi:ATP-dependent DNA helicase RecQ